jgi:hypothetical protein
VQQPMTSTDVLVAGVIGALSPPAARLYVIFTALGVVIVCVAFATTMEVIMATTLARTTATHREDFWICILIVFILDGFLSELICVSRGYQMSVTLPACVKAVLLWTRIVSALATWMSTV